MKMSGRARAIAGIALAIMILCTRAAGAQSWEWNFVVRLPDRGPVSAQTRVVLSPRDVVMTYSADLNNRTVPITTCRASLSDIGDVHSANNGGNLFLFIVLKAQRSANCNSGNQSIALVPVSNNAAVNTAVTTIMRSCCQAPAVVARATPARATVAQATPAPATPAPRPSATVAPPLLGTVDWVESQGLFAFVRVLNRTDQRVTIGAGRVLDCRDVAYGCGTFIDSPVTLAPGEVMTLATIMSSNPGKGATFSYRYEVQNGSARLTESGLSGKPASDPKTAMSALDIRSAEAAAIGGMRGRPATSSAPPPPAFVPPKLLQRGSSRFGVGQRGVAVVRVGVGRNGMAQYATVVSITNAALVSAALETAVSTTFTPAMRNGQPVDGNYVATFQFDGSDPALSSIPVWRRAPIATPSASLRASASASPSAVPSPSPSPSPVPKPIPSPSPSPAPTHT
jgi:hypothetical protein